MNHLPNQKENPQVEPSFCTSFPWTIASHPDTEGGYVIHEARHEQQTWCDLVGYDISIEEGDRRSLLVARHEAGNIRLLQAAPVLFVALRGLTTSTVTATAARTVLESIFPDWQQLEIHDNQGEHS